MSVHQEESSDYYKKVWESLVKGINARLQDQGSITINFTPEGAQQDNYFGFNPDYMILIVELVINNKGFSSKCNINKNDVISVSNIISIRATEVVDASTENEHYRVQGKVITRDENGAFNCEDVAAHSSYSDCDCPPDAEAREDKDVDDNSSLLNSSSSSGSSSSSSVSSNQSGKTTIYILIDVLNANYFPGCAAWSPRLANKKGPRHYPGNLSWMKCKQKVNTTSR